MPKQVIPFFMFQGDAGPAHDLYTSPFDDARVLELDRRGADGPGAEGTLKGASSSIAGQVVGDRKSVA